MGGHFCCNREGDSLGVSWIARWAFLHGGPTPSFELWVVWLFLFFNVRWHSACDKGKEGKKHAGDCAPTGCVGSGKQAAKTPNPCVMFGKVTLSVLMGFWICRNGHSGFCNLTYTQGIACREVNCFLAPLRTATWKQVSSVDLKDRNTYH